MRRRRVARNRGSVERRGMEAGGKEVCLWRQQKIESACSKGKDKVAGGGRWEGAACTSD